MRSARRRDDESTTETQRLRRHIHRLQAELADLKRRLPVEEHDDQPDPEVAR